MTPEPDTFNDDVTLPRPGPSGVWAPPIRVSDWGACSSTGVVRAANEDAWGERDGRVFAVADGMGGRPGGSQASSIAVAQLLAADPVDGWMAILRRLNDTVLQGCAAGGFPGAGSTLVALVVEQHHCVTLHVGDSRIYQLRGGQLEQLTTDHSLAGFLPSAEARCERVTSRALISFLGNPDHDQRLDIGIPPAQPGDRFILCSDGVHTQLGESAIASLTDSSPCSAAAHDLVAAADAAGGNDNATAIVIEMAAA